MSRSEGERIRARHLLASLAGMAASARIAIEDTNAPPGADVGQALTQAATSLAVTLGRLDAYMRAEDDARLTTTPR